MLATVTPAWSALGPRSSAARLLRDSPPALIGFAPVFGLALRNGGFFATAWGWWAVAALLLVALLLATRTGVALGRWQVGFLCLLAALVAWTALSSLWATGAGTPLLETERSALYLALAAAALLAPGSASPRALAAGLLTACVLVSAWGLAVRLDLRTAGTADLEGYRIAGPLGYSNGVGLVAVLGILLALGFAVHGPPLGRAVASASLAVLGPTLALTFSRGSWLALIAGLVVLLALEHDRLVRLAAAAAAPVLAVAASVSSSALGGSSAPAAEVTREEHRLLAIVLALAVLGALLALLADRIPAPRIGRRALLGAAAAATTLALAAGIVGLVRVGGPGAAVHRALSTFRSESSGSGLSHVFSGSGSYRSDYWSVASRELAAHPLLGGGAGSFGAWWLRLRRIGFGGLDAHGLYIETLAELGAVGLLLLGATLAAPFALARRVRGAPLAAACAAAYVAFLVHAALDWDWELPAAGLAGLLCGVALLRAEPAALAIPRPVRAAGAVAAAALAAFVFVMHVGNVALDAGESALAGGRIGPALEDARRAERWQPWSSSAALLLGRAQLATGDRAAATASFRRAIERDGSDWEAWSELARVTGGRESAAARAEASRLNPFGVPADASGNGG